VTRPVDVTTTMTAPAGESIASWSVTATGAHGGSVTLASGTGAPPATLAVFDPTVLPNDTYTITVTGTSTAGGVQTASTTVVVQGNLKPGRYITTFQDAVLPVDGFQIGLRRVYDSIDVAPRELGFNWHLSLSDFRVSSNGALGNGGWSAAPSRCSLFFCEYVYRSTAPHAVTVTYPNAPSTGINFLSFYGAGGSGSTIATGYTSLTSVASAPYRTGYDLTPVGNTGATMGGSSPGQQLLAVNIVDGIGASGRVKVWNGSAWVQRPTKVWDGSTWVSKPTKFWNGSSWS